MTGGSKCGPPDRTAAPWSLAAFRRFGHPALLGRTVEDRKIELLVAGIEGGEEIEDLVDDFVMALVGAVDLVDGDDGLEADLQRLLQHEFGLRHRAFGGIDQQHGAIDHVEDALDLAAEIGVARRVDDVDAGVLPDERGHLGEDGDAALALEIVRIHGALGDLLVVAEGAGLGQQPVDHGRLAMVDMGNDGNVAQIHGAPELSLLSGVGRRIAWPHDKGNSLESRNLGLFAPYSSSATKASKAARNCWRISSLSRRISCKASRIDDRDACHPFGKAPYGFVVNHAVQACRHDQDRAFQALCASSWRAGLRLT